MRLQSRVCPERAGSIHRPAKIDNLRTHGGIASMARWALIYRSLCGGRLHATLQSPRTRDWHREAEPLYDDTGHGNQLPMPIRLEQEPNMRKTIVALAILLPFNETATTK